jgi:hypothetical protein
MRGFACSLPVRRLAPGEQSLWCVPGLSVTVTRPVRVSSESGSPRRTKVCTSTRGQARKLFRDRLVRWNRMEIYRGFDWRSLTKVDRARSTGNIKAHQAAGWAKRSVPTRTWPQSTEIRSKPLLRDRLSRVRAPVRPDRSAAWHQRCLRGIPSFSSSRRCAATPHSGSGPDRRHTRDPRADRR